MITFLKDLVKRGYSVGNIPENGDELIRILQAGITNDLDNRLKQHRGEIPGGAKYTRSRSPLKLVYREQCGSRSEALKRELIIKKLTRSAKLELIEDRINSEADLSH